MAVLAPRRAHLRSVGDRRLAALAADGDESAFEAIFERHHRGLLSFCRHLLGSPEEAEDVLQHTFAAAYRQLTERGPLEHLRAWLYRTARNRCTDILRARRDLPAPAPEVSTAGLPEEVERRSDLRELVSDIGRLPDDQRAALVLSEIEDLGHAEVADVLGCRRDKVRALVYQARSSLAGWREARQLPCREVREEIAVAHGGGLRRAHLRRHLKLCAGCAAFRKDMDRQRRSVALVLPVLAAAGLKERVLEAALAGAGAAAGGGGAAAGGGGAAGGGAAAGGGGAAAGSLGAAGVKIGAALLVLGGAGIATFGGLSGGGGQAPDSAGPAPSAQPASAVAREDQARRDQRRAQREEREQRRLSVREQPPAPAGESVEQLSGAESESLEPAPAPPSSSPAPGGGSAPEQPPAGDQAPAPSPDGQSPGSPSPGGESPGGQSPGGQSPGGQSPSPQPQPAPPQPAPAPQPPAEPAPAPQSGIEAEIEAQLPALP